MVSRKLGLRVGLTGGIGSGKSTVAAMLADLGAVIIDTDAIARELTSPGGAAVGAIRDAFGCEFVEPSGALDRAAMRSLIFADPGAKLRLEAILHPLIGKETERRAAATASQSVVFDVPLLVESGRWRDRVDKVLVVDCSEVTQVERVVVRSGWSPEAVRAVIAQQATRAERRSAADAVIFNDGISPAELAHQVAQLWQQWNT